MSAYCFSASRAVIFLLSVVFEFDILAHLLVEKKSFFFVIAARSVQSLSMHFLTHFTCRCLVITRCLILVRFFAFVRVFNFDFDVFSVLSFSFVSGSFGCAFRWHVVRPQNYRLLFSFFLFFSCAGLFLDCKQLPKKENRRKQITLCRLLFFFQYFVPSVHFRFAYLKPLIFLSVFIVLFAQKRLRPRWKLFFLFLCDTTTSSKWDYLFFFAFASHHKQMHFIIVMFLWISFPFLSFASRKNALILNINATNCSNGHRSRFDFSSFFTAFLFFWEKCR